MCVELGVWLDSEVCLEVDGSEVEDPVLVVSVVEVVDDEPGLELDIVEEDDRVPVERTEDC